MYDETQDDRYSTYDVLSTVKTWFLCLGVVVPAVAGFTYLGTLVFN